MINGTESVDLMSHEEFNLSQFLDRWSRARIGALKKTLGAQHLVSDDENALLMKVKEQKLDDKALKLVFDHSRKLALSLVSFLGVVLELKDIEGILKASQSPCMTGKWTSRSESISVLERHGCEAHKSVGSLYCSFWREAIDGFVTGAGENERYARHASVGFGDSTCTDVFFVEHSVGLKKLSLGSIPPQLKTSLDAAVEKLRAMKIDVELHGYKEGTLFYMMKPFEGVLCGASGKIMEDAWNREVAKLGMNLKTKDISPQAVMGTEKE